MVRQYPCAQLFVSIGQMPSMQGPDFYSISVSGISDGPVDGIVCMAQRAYVVDFGAINGGLLLNHSFCN